MSFGSGKRKISYYERFVEVCLYGQIPTCRKHQTTLKLECYAQTKTKEY